MRRTTLVLILAPVVAVVSPAPAVALCAAAPPLGRAIEDAETVFVGTVEELSNDDRWAVVSVSDVWKGDVAAEVQVRGGPEDPPGPMQVASSVDRTFAEGETYLFLPQADGGGVFLDDSCTATTRYRDEHEKLRPAGAYVPPAAPAPPESASFPWLPVAAVAAAVAAMATVLLRPRAA